MSSSVALPAQLVIGNDLNSFNRLKGSVDKQKSSRLKTSKIKENESVSANKIKKQAELGVPHSRRQVKLD